MRLQSKELSNNNDSCLSSDRKTQASSLLSRNISVLGHRTSIRLEPEMWESLKDIARREHCTVHDICSLVAARKRDSSSLTASIRVFVMLYFRAAATEDGHVKSGHGSLAKMLHRAGLQATALAARLSQDEESQYAVAG
jgi:predicted DNA-binding ribbon-helix-helix protein